jgi:glutamate synthase (NADPH/NADH) small chain
MGKPKGFLQIPRKDPGYRLKSERVRDYEAVEKNLGHGEILEQAARCMDCGTPFCHAYGCPVSNVIPEFNDFVFRGMWREALQILLSENNFPEFTGRICPAPCEAACVAGIVTDPVTIRQIELAIVEMGFERGYILPDPPKVLSGKRVGIVGSGPAGLAAADCLNRAGYPVTVYESDLQPGGILRYGIPDFKLEKWVVKRRIKLMEEQGVVFETGIKVGEDISYRYLTRHFDAICLACGARRPRDIQVPGRDLNGIFFAMDYLVRQNRLIAGESVDPSGMFSAKGRKVVVIGGGDTGSDCVGTALRQGAVSVEQLEILSRPPESRSETTPWPMWPLLLRKTHAHEEGSEPRWGVITKEFSGNKGSVEKLHCAEVRWESPGNGAPAVPLEIPGTEFFIEADMVLFAMGFEGPEKNPMVEGLGLEADARGNLKVDKTGMTGVAGVFVAGDMSLGQSLVVRAIADGRKAAQGIKGYFSRLIAD